MPPLDSFPRSLRDSLEPVRELGRGGMGVVYLARDPNLEREVAVKVLSGTEVRSLERFHREAEAMARLSHPNVVRVFDHGQEEERAYLVMEYLEGEDLETRRKRHPGERFPGRVLLPLLLQVAEGLEAVHQEDMVHRDLKETNVLVVDERAVIVDFGLAHEGGRTHLTAENALVGTIPYLAPELMDGYPASPASDFYALGVLAFQGLEGRLPFTSDQILAGVRPEPRGSGETRRAWPLVEALLEPDPAHRPCTRAALEAILEGSAPSGRKSRASRRSLATPALSSTSQVPPRPGRAGLLGVGIGAALALLALLVLGISSRTGSPPGALPTTRAGSPNQATAPGVAEVEALGADFEELVRTLHDPEGLSPGIPERFSRRDRTAFLFRHWEKPETMPRVRRLIARLGSTLEALDGSPSPAACYRDETVQAGFREAILPGLEAFTRDRYYLKLRARTRVLLAFAAERPGEFRANLEQEERVYGRIPEVQALLLPLLLRLRERPRGLPRDPWPRLATRVRLGAFYGKHPELLPELTEALLRGIQETPEGGVQPLLRAGLSLLESTEEHLPEALRRRLLGAVTPARLEARTPGERVGQAVRWIHCWLVDLRFRRALPDPGDLRLGLSLLQELEANWRKNPGDVARYANLANTSLTLYSLPVSEDFRPGTLARRLFLLQKQASLRLGDTTY